MLAGKVSIICHLNVPGAIDAVVISDIERVGKRVVCVLQPVPCLAIEVPELGSLYGIGYGLDSDAKLHRGRTVGDLRDGDEP